MRPIVDDPFNSKCEVNHQAARQSIAALRAICPYAPGLGCHTRPRGRKSTGPWCVQCRAAIILERQIARLELSSGTLKRINKRCQMVEAAAAANAYSEEGRRIAKYLHDQIRSLRAELLELRRYKIKYAIIEHECKESDAHTDALARADGQSGVYFIHWDGLIKIGMSREAPARLRNLRQTYFGVLTPLGFIHEQDNKPRSQIERDLHKRFTTHRQKNEWFRDHPDIRAYIAAHASPWPWPSQV